MKNNLNIVYKGEIKYSLNSNLIRKQKLSSDNIENIKSLHVKKLEIFDKMNETENHNVLKELAMEVEIIELKLQTLWGFTENRNMHEWYNVPKCSCPKLDNMENRGTEFRIINEACPVHGKQN